MVRLIECDNCAGTTPEGHAFGWLSVEVTEESGMMGRDEEDKAFCSWKCLSQFAGKRQDTSVTCLSQAETTDRPTMREIHEQAHEAMRKERDVRNQVLDSVRERKGDIGIPGWAMPSPQDFPQGVIALNVYVGKPGRLVGQLELIEGRWVEKRVDTDRGEDA